MLRATIFGLIGAGAMYLYLNPGDMAGLIEMARGAVHDAALWLTNNTAK
jgi:hypothetical protein